MMTWRVITMVVAGMLAVGAAREATPAAPGDGLVGTTWHTARIDGDALFLAYDWGPIGPDAATITHRRATLTRGGLR